MTAEIKYRGRTVTAEDIAFIRQLIAENPEDSRRSPIREALSGMGLDTGERRLPGHGMPGTHAHAAPEGIHNASRKETNPPQSVCGPLEARKDQDRLIAPSRLFVGPPPAHLAAGPKHGSGSPGKRPDRDVPLPGILPPGGGAPEISRIRGGSAGRLLRVVFRGAAHRLPGPLYRLDAKGSRPSPPLHGLQQPVPHSALGARPASCVHLLGRMARMISDDWENAYRHPVWFLETFVDTDRFTGVCYKAANWRYLGDTTGRGKNDQTHAKNRSIKAVWGYPRKGLPATDHDRRGCMKPPKPIEVDAEELSALKERVASGAIQEGDREILSG